jgi:hypothetical protein
VDIKIGILTLGLLAAPIAQADLYFELGYEAGGDELIGTTTGDSISAGGGAKFAAGFQSPVGDDDSASVRLVLGYLTDSVDAYNGDADISTVTFDAMYIFNSGSHRFGIGPTVHINPKYSDNVAGYAPLDIEFDNAVGLMFEYGYKVTPQFEVGARWTNIEYTKNSATLDAGGIGIFLSNGF